MITCNIRFAITDYRKARSEGESNGGYAYVLATYYVDT